ncbi:MAG: hypothetical protein RMK57_06120 [Bryobacterales bacterium]|nr:hypothetical protein [Bryobacteraceae bacterium]MDW8354091.1 hypothetical protein [Bryobacterales bacterium]
MTPLLCLLVAFLTGNPLAGILSRDNLARADISRVLVEPGQRPDTVVLRFQSAEQPGSLVLPVPEAARDWTRWGGLTFEFLSDSTIRWQLEIRNRRGETFTYRIHPYQGVRVKASIPASFLLREYMNNRPFKGYWISNWGNHIDLSDVVALAIRMHPNRTVTLHLGLFALTRDVEPDEVYLDRPVVDEFGQWAPLEWPGKVRSVDELRAAWKREEQELARTPDFGYCDYGGWKERKHRATGFFYATEIAGRWWLVDPDGHLFFSTGMDCVRYRDPSPLLSGREKLFFQLPPESAETVDFYHANARLRYSEADFVGRWKQTAARRLRSWGFNTVGNWSDPALHQDPPLPFVTNVRIGRTRKSWQGYPDAYSEEFARTCEEDAVAQCGRFRQEPRLIGYFIGNEPRWPQRNLIDLILRDPEPTATQEFVRKFLRDRGDTDATRAALLEELSRKYFRTVTAAIRKADPNHMVLGIRWAGSAPDPVLRANDVFDVFSINIYRFEPPADQIRHIYRLVKRPVLIGEFHFGAAERGLAPSLVMVKDQTERGVAYQYYVERAAAQAAIVGTHYFQLCDQPATGRFDGENYNLGFVDVVDRPYPELVEFARRTHRRVYRVHAGEVPPTDRQAQVR